MFIQIIQGRCTRQDDMRAHTDRWLREIAPHAEGWLGGTYGFTDDDRFVGVVRFESAELAAANATRADQQAWWAEAERLFDGPVEFHDAEKVLVMLDGGSDDAGFVQVIRGRIDDAAMLESELTEMSNMLHQARPEIIGSTFAIEDDGTFTETVSFTSEDAARRGEQQAMPVTDEVRHLMQDWDRMTHDVTYLDLHRPWFATGATAAGR